MAATLALTGFQWLTLKPVEPKQTEPTGEALSYIGPTLKQTAQQELRWAWDALRTSTTCRSLVVIYNGRVMCHEGLAAWDYKPGRIAVGSIMSDVMRSSRANYLANLILFPGRVEFEKFLPPDLSAVIVAPIGKNGVLVAASDTVRGFSRLDQAWISSIADKLEDTLEAKAPASLASKPRD